MRAAQDPDSMALTPFASATSSGRWIWQENKKNQGSKRKPFLVRSRLYCRGRSTLFAFDASLLSAMLRNMLLATAEEANRMLLLLLSPACAGLAGWQWELSKHFLLVRCNISQAIHWTTMPHWTFVLS